MYLAFYKAPGNWLDRLIRRVEKGPYSHVELVVAQKRHDEPEWGMCMSSSPRDGGVRAKSIAADRGSWGFVPLAGDLATEFRAVKWFSRNLKARYDWLGALRTQVHWLPQCPNRWFCVEAVATALGRKDLAGLGVNDFFLAMTAEQNSSEHKG